MTSIADNYSKLDHETPKPDPENPNSCDSNFCLRYLVKNNYFFQKNAKPIAAVLATQEANKCRMTSLYSGSVHFPYEARHEVLAQIAMDRACQRTPKSYWNQIAYETDGVRLVVDIDATRVIAPAELDKFGLYLSETLREYFPKSIREKPIDVVCSVCGPRLKKGVQSSGVHMIAHVQATFDQARQIIFAFKLRLHTDRLLDMSAIEIDAGIYKTNMVNLRLIYNYKIEKCPVCNDQMHERICCHFCDHSGLVTSNHTYIPQKCFQATAAGSVIDDERFKELHKDMLSVFQSNSIWAESDELREDYTRPERHPLHTCELKPSGPATKAKTPRGGKTATLTLLDKSNQGYDMLQNFLWRIVFNGVHPWEGIIITDIKITGKKNSATIAVTGVGSNWCVYANKAHGNNRIYFTLKKQGLLTVHCHSKKYNCQEEAKREFEVPLVISNHIFQCPNNDFNFKSLFPVHERASQKREADLCPTKQEERIKRIKDRNHLSKLAELSAFYKAFLK
jgi:hypothetical protein